MKRKAMYRLTDYFGKLLGSYEGAEEAICEAERRADQDGPGAAFYVDKREAVVTRMVGQVRTVEVVRYR